MRLSPITALAATLSLGSSLVSANCLSYQQAHQLATNFGLLISDYSASLANQTLAPSYTDYSESVNTLIDNGGSSPIGLLSATFSSRAQFETASAAQPAVPFTVADVWYTCNVITVRWESAQSPNTVVGISVLQATQQGVSWKNPVGWWINEVWAEFDSAVWLTNLGFKITAPS